MSREYVTGVNFLLSDQRDKAENLFLDLLKQESNTVEAHMTLGNLFRSRGEVDRAIRIHQSLIESATLSYDQRLLAVQQLGRDYMAAGLYDRAEKVFSGLVDEHEYRTNALQQLLFIYQATSEWARAIDVCGKLLKVGKVELRNEIAHYYCELALLALANEDTLKAISQLKKAETFNNLSARVSIMCGRLFSNLGEYSKAIFSLEQIVVRDKALIGEALPLLEKCYQHTRQFKQWRHFLQRCVDEDSGVVAQLYLADVIENQEGVAAAQQFISQQLKQHPTLQGFHRLISYYLREIEDGRARESLTVLRDMVAEQIRVQPLYRCGKCGFSSHTFYWQCPSCRTWSSIKPISGLSSK